MRRGISVPAVALPRDPAFRRARDAQATDLGLFTSEEAPGAWRNGTRVNKRTWEPGDSYPIGTLGTVCGSVGPMPLEGHPEVYGYFVVFDPAPELPAFCVSLKLEPAGSDAARAPAAPGASR